MKNLIKTFALFICMLILMSLISPAFSGATYYIIDGYKVTKNSDGSFELAGLKDETSTELIVPEELAGCPVTSIASNAFLNNEILTTVVFSDTIKEIKNGAFSGCTALKSAVIPESVTKIGSNAFYNCSSMTELIINANITQISSYTFNRCKSLKSVVIPDTVEKICEYAFYSCLELEKVHISSSIKKIDKYAFYACSKLDYVTIKSKDSELVIEDTAFDDLNYSDITIAGVPGTASQDYAVRNGIDFEVFGDINTDGEVNGNDVTACLKYLVQIIGESEINVNTADVNGDGVINIKDATRLQKTVLGLV